MSAFHRFRMRLSAVIARARAALRDPASLSARVFSASAWRLGGKAANVILRLGSNLVLTRLLAPDDFGLMAMALTIQAGLMMATDIGLNMSVIRSDHGEDERFLRTIWTIKLLKHIVIGLVMVAAAMTLGALLALLPVGGTVYADPALPMVVAGLALTLVLRGANSANMALGQRRMRLGRVTAVQVGSQVVGVAAMLSIALVEPSVWALVIGGWIGAAAACALSHLIVPGPRMGFVIDKAHFHEIWSFGKWLMGASVFGFLGQQGDRLILGALLAPADFGIYAIARIWVDAAVETSIKLAEPTATAALSEVRRDAPRRLPGVFRKVRLVIAAMCVSLFAFFALFGEAFITLLYTPQYHAVGGLLVVLSPILLLRAWNGHSMLLLSTGNSRNFAWVTFVRCAMLFATVPLAFTQLGPSWAYFFVAINGVFGAVAVVTQARKVLPVSIPQEIALLAVCVALAVLVTVAAP